MKTKFSVQTGGKLYLAGEYAILSPGQSAIIQFIPIYMTAEIEESKDYVLSSDMFSHQASLEKDKDYALIQETIAWMNAYLQLEGISPKAFRLTIRGKMEREGKKYGIGSSGSVVVLTLKAMATLHGLTISRDRLFQLASICLLARGDNGSMGDLACIAYEDLIYYRTFNRQEIAKKLDELSLKDLLDLDWGYEIRSIEPSLSFDFLVGWTMEPAISKDLVNQVKSAISEKFLRETQVEVDRLEQALLKGQERDILDGLEKVSQLLLELSPAISHSKLADLRAASQGLRAVAKSSGAGGGDCGIALSFDEKSSQILREKWQEKGIVLLYEERIGRCQKTEKTSISAMP